MKARINPHGILEIERAGKWHEQYCPFAGKRREEDIARFCTHFCPLFVEIEADHLGIVGGCLSLVELHCGDGEIQHVLIEDLRLRAEKGAD